MMAWPALIRFVLAVSAVATAAAFAGADAVSRGSLTLGALATVLSLLAVAGIAVLVHVVIVVERQGRRPQ